MSLKPFEIDYAEARREVPVFLEVYRRRPIQDNAGGMGFNHSFATWFILKTLQPRIVIESGVWKGHSTWLIEQACPEAELFSLDIDLSKVEYRSDRAHYIQADFAECDWSAIDTQKAVAFLDDHQNAYARLKDLWWAGIRHAIFEDNFPVGEGDCYSLRHIDAGCGVKSLQLSKAYRGGLKQRLKLALKERVLRSIGARQQMLVHPNTNDRSNLKRRMQTYFEFPPVARRERTHWGGDWSGHYASVEPLFKSVSEVPELAALYKEAPSAFDYFYLAYVRLA